MAETKRDATNDTCRMETKLRDSATLGNILPKWACQEFIQAADMIAKQRDAIALMGQEIRELRQNISRGR